MVVNIVPSASQRALSSRIAVCSWSLKPGTPLELIDRLRRLNIPAVQLALSPLVHEPGIWGNAIEELRAAGIWIVSGMMAMAGEDYSTIESITRTGGVRPDQTWFLNSMHAEQIARLASRQGIELVTFHAGFMSEDPANPERAKMIDRLRTIAEIFDHYDVNIGLETGQETAFVLNQVLDQLDRANVGVNFDPANMILYGKGDPVDSLRTLAGRVRQIHVKDAKPSRVAGEWGREVPVGKGVVNWEAFFEAALAISPPVPFVIERESRTGTQADITVASELIAYHLGPKRGSLRATD
jgi:L-ribulose-5-phosphate 3-epimerase